MPDPRATEAIEEARSASKNLRRDEQLLAYATEGLATAHGASADRLDTWIATAKQGSEQTRNAAGEFGGLKEALDATRVGTSRAAAAFATAAREQLPEMIGQLSALEEQALAAALAQAKVAAELYGGPSAAGRAAGGGGSTNPRLRPGGGEAWQDFYSTALNLAKHGGTERERTLGCERARSAAAELGIPIPAFAHGTAFAPGGLALVGETGPELVNLPRGSQVTPAAGRAIQVTVNVTVQGSVVAERDLARSIREELIRNQPSHRGDGVLTSPAGPIVRAVISPQPPRPAPEPGSDDRWLAQRDP